MNSRFCGLRLLLHNLHSYINKVISFCDCMSSNLHCMNSSLVLGSGMGIILRHCTMKTSRCFQFKNNVFHGYSTVFTFYNIICSFPKSKYMSCILPLSNTSSLQKSSSCFFSIETHVFTLSKISWELTVTCCAVLSEDCETDRDCKLYRHTKTNASIII